MPELTEENYDALDGDDIIECRVCGKYLGYWEDELNIRSTEGFRMCGGGFTCLPCLETDDDCE